MFGAQLAAEKRHIGGFLVGWKKILLLLHCGGGDDEVTGKACAGDTSEWSFPRWIDCFPVVIILTLCK